MRARCPAPISRTPTGTSPWPAPPPIRSPSIFATRSGACASGSPACSTSSSSATTPSSPSTATSTAAARRARLLAQPHDLYRLNLHGTHLALGKSPRDWNERVTAAEVANAAGADAPDLRGRLVVSIACQSGLNVPDEDGDGSGA